jgi:hypothetical protein
MTAASATNTVSRSHGLLAGELVDSLIEAVVLPPDPLARSGVICELLNELYDAVDWLHGAETALTDPVAPETASLRQLVTAARDHQRRMRAFGAANYGFGGER